MAVSISVITSISTFVVSQNSDNEETPAPNASPEVNSNEVYCQKDSDCVMVLTDCSCNCGIPVNKKFEKKYLEIKEEKCKSYTGPQCKMLCNLTPRCVKNACAFRDD